MQNPQEKTRQKSTIVLLAEQIASKNNSPMSLAEIERHYKVSPGSYSVRRVVQSPVFCPNCSCTKVGNTYEVGMPIDLGTGEAREIQRFRCGTSALFAHIPAFVLI